MAAYSPVPGSDAPSPTEPLVATPRASPRVTGAPAAAEATPPTTPNEVAQATPQATYSKAYPPASPGDGGAPKRFLAFSTGPRQVRLSTFHANPPRDACMDCSVVQLGRQLPTYGISQPAARVPSASCISTWRRGKCDPPCHLGMLWGLIYLWLG